MQILTYPFGVLIGTLTIAVDLGTTPPPAVLRLDGKPVCALVEKQSACDVDLGTTPHPHVLDAVRLDANGAIVERVARTLNVPGATAAEARLLPECSPEKKSCAVRFGWLHPEKKPLRSAQLTIDGAEKPIPPNGVIDVPYDPVRGHLVTVDLDFGDDDRIVFSELVGPTRRAETGVALRAVPVAFDGEPKDLEKRLREKGRAIEAVERGDAEVTFVVEMGAMGPLTPMTAGRTAFLSERLTTPNLITVVPASHPVGTTFPRFATRVSGQITEGIQRSVISIGAGPSMRTGSGATAGGPIVGGVGGPRIPDWLLRLLAGLRGRPTKPARVSDAVAAAGFSLGASPRRRALVVLLGDDGDESRMEPEGVRAYLKEIAVPLVVLRFGAARPAWPEATPVANTAELARALSSVRTMLGGQVVVWAPAETPLSDLAP